MKQPVDTEDLERREFHLTIFACSAILVLTAGLAVLMYAAVFSQEQGTAAPRIAFVGFCVLSVLLVAYIVDRQLTIGRLRKQITGDRRKSLAAKELASRELLSTLPNLGSLQDRLPMEYRRSAASGQPLTIFVIHIELHPDFSARSAAQTAIGDAAKAIARKLREQDSIYLLQMCYFAIVMPGLLMSSAPPVSARISEGLTDAAGALERFSFKVDVINYPEHASSARELESLVCALMPDDLGRRITPAEVSH